MAMLIRFYKNISENPWVYIKEGMEKTNIILINGG